MSHRRPEKKSLVVFDTRIVKVVAKHYLDFVAKPLDGKSSSLVIRAVWENGRGEGSRYPNLMVPRKDGGIVCD